MQTVPIGNNECVLVLDQLAVAGFDDRLSRNFGIILDVLFLLFVRGSASIE